jgi:hypothetical protein
MFTLSFWWHLFYSISFLCNLLSTIVCPFVHLSVVLSVFLQFMTSDYPFDAVPAPLVAPVALLLIDTHMIRHEDHFLNQYTLNKYIYM